MSKSLVLKTPYLIILSPAAFLVWLPSPLRCSFCSFFNKLALAKAKTSDSSLCPHQEQTHEEGFSLTLPFWRKRLFPVLTLHAAAAKSLQSCPTLCDPIDGSPPGSTVPGILQARTLEWVAISFSKAWKWKVKVKSLSSFWLLATPQTAAYQAPLSMRFSRQEY